MSLKLGTVAVDITATTGGLDAAEQEFKRAGKTLTDTFTKTGAEVERQFTRMKGELHTAAAETQRTAAQTGTQVTGAFGRMRAAGARLIGGFRPMKGAVQQAAFQVQDFAVQLGMGTNALVSFSQQAPQLLGVFGPGGAIVGAIVGVGAAVGASLLPALFQSKDAMTVLEEATTSLDETLRRAARDGGVTLLTDKIIELAKESEAAARVELRATMVRALEAIDAAAESAGEALSGVLGGNFVTGGKTFLGEITALSQRLGLTTRQVDDLRSAVMELDRDGSAENIRAVQETLDRIVDESPNASTELITLASNFREISEQSGKAAERLATAEKFERDLTDAVRESTKTLEDNIEVQAKRVSAARTVAEANRQIREQAAKQLQAEREEAKRQTGNTGIDRLNESDLERINREAAERRQFVLEQEQLTADRRSELLASIRERQITETNDFNDRLLEAERSAQEKRAQQEEAAAQQMAQTRAAQQTAALAGLTALGDNANKLLAETGQEGSAIAKAIFLSMKAIQVAQILAATEVAAANAAAVAAVGGPVSFFATQGAIRAAGYTSAALVAGMAVGETFGGGRQMGGPVSPQLAHPINERGTPEILNMAGRQYLLPTGQGGTITPMKQGAGGGSPSVTVINQGTPQQYAVESYTADEIRLIARDEAQRGEGRINASLASGRGDTAASLRRGYRVERNLK
jgi:hypothetical protein